MSLDHVLARDALGTPLDEAGRARAESVLRSFGFERGGDGWTFEDGVAWVTVTEDAGSWRVSVLEPLPGHVVEPALAALEGLVKEAGLVRIDLFTRGELSAREWAGRLAGVSLVPSSSKR